MYTLFSMPGACSMSDHIALVWSGLDYNVHFVNHDSLDSPEYLAKNPQGQVPLLEKDGWSLTQNAAILNYIAEKAPETNIGPQDTPESRADFLRWLSYVSADYHKAFGNIFGAGKLGLAEDATVILKKAAIENLKNAHLKKMDTYLATHQFIFENRKTVIDAYFWVVTSWAYNFVPTLATDYPSLHAYFERIKQDAGIQKVIADQKAAK